MNQEKQFENSNQSEIKIIFLPDGNIRHETQGTITTTMFLAAKEYLRDATDVDRQNKVLAADVAILDTLKRIVGYMIQQAEREISTDGNRPRNNPSNSDVSVLLPVICESTEENKEVDG